LPSLPSFGMIPPTPPFHHPSPREYVRAPMGICTRGPLSWTRTGLVWRHGRGLCRSQGSMAGRGDAGTRIRGAWRLIAAATGCGVVMPYGASMGTRLGAPVFGLCIYKSLWFDELTVRAPVDDAMATGDPFRPSRGTFPSGEGKSVVAATLRFIITAWTLHGFPSTYVRISISNQILEPTTRMDVVHYPWASALRPVAALASVLLMIPDPISLSLMINPPVQGSPRHSRAGWWVVEGRSGGHAPK